MNNYDVIIVGAGNSGLISALTLLKNGYKVLLLDEHNNVGGFSQEKRKGRFIFDRTFNKFYLNNDNKEPYKLDNILKNIECKEKINYSSLSEVCQILTPEKSFNIPFGIDNYIDMVEELVPDSRKSLETFFNLAYECREAMDYIIKNVDRIDYDFIKKEFYNFMKVSGYSLSKVLDAIGMPLEAQEIVNVLWILLGSSEIEISFVEYAVLLLNIIEYGLRVPSDNGYSIPLSLANDYFEKGGELKLNSKVIKLLVDDNCVNGVKLQDGTIYYANHIIFNSSLHNVCCNLLSPSEVPRDAIKSMNKRELGGRVFTVNLALNRSAEELGLNKYTYIIYHSLDSDLEYNRMKEIANGNQISFVYNNANKDVSPIGTCLVSLNTIFFDDCYNDYVDKESIFNDDREVAQRLIQVFQKYTNVKIDDYIEEIEIVTPLVNMAEYGVVKGCTYGYKLSGFDNLLPRILNADNENYINGLYLCEGFDGDIFGYNSSFVSGYQVALKVENDIRGDK